MPRTIPCGHASLVFTCPTCQEAIADPGGKGAEWGVVDLEGPTQAKATAKLKLELRCVHAHNPVNKVAWCVKFRHPVTGEQCGACSEFALGLMPDLVDPLSTGIHPEPQHKRIEGWSHSQDTKIAHLSALAQIVRLPNTPPPRTGQGIVTVGGGRYWPGVVIGIKMLRATGSDLPVEIWHGADEEVRPEDLAGLGAVSLHKIDPTSPDVRTVHGWTNKLYALTHTQLRRVLFLDADAYCVVDPTPLLYLLDAAPFVFWSDMAFHEKDINWEMVYPAGCAAHLPVIQGGQLLIDIADAWPVVRLAHWICQHSDFYFGHIYGDQDAWRVALSALAWQVSWMHLGPATWRHPCFVCNHEDVDWIVHRCQGKFFLNDLPREAQALRWLLEIMESQLAPPAA